MNERINRFRCCFCGESVPLADYAELELSVAGDVGFQIFGTHREHFTAALASGFNVLLPGWDKS